MIIYHATKATFVDDVLNGNISELIHQQLHSITGKSVGASERASWNNSMIYMGLIMQDPTIPVDAMIWIEYHLPQSSKRIDFMISGKDSDGYDHVVLIELKQWSSAELTSKDAIVRTYLGKGLKEVTHPSYQVWSYMALLQGFNQTIEDDNIQLHPCAYIHNCTDDTVLRHPFYNAYLTKAPLFLKNDAKALGSFIKQFIKTGDSSQIVQRIDQGRFRPSKSLAGCIEKMLKGNDEFFMIDEQKIVFEEALSHACSASPSNKQVLIIEGGPGTGKSVVAINLLVTLTSKGLTARYVTKNAAPRTVYESKLTGSFRKSEISNFFSGSGAFIKTQKNSFETLIVDEAHRLNARSGMFKNMGENQIKEIIEAAQCSIFFIDEDQKVTFEDIGEKEEIITWAHRIGATITTMELNSQFRCNGADGYLAWLDNVLQIRETANQKLDDINYDFRVLDSAEELRDLIVDKNNNNNSARLVAGYCWNWASKKNPHVNDISLGNMAMKWNLSSDGNLWILAKSSVNEIGCIHTCQGLELDYIGVIIGPDLIVRNGHVITNPSKRAKTDKSLSGYKTLLKTNPNEANRKAEAIIKNTYRTLMTRGTKGCYVYCTDFETKQYFQQL